MNGQLVRKRYAVIIFSATMLAFLLTVTPKAFSEEKVITWDFSLWSTKRAWTAPLHDWAAEMEKKTNGRWKIKLHYGGVLAPPKECLDGIKGGMFQAAGICATYTPGKNPLHTVCELPFIAPHENVNIIRMLATMWEHPALRRELLKWNAVPLLPSGTGSFEIMGTKPLRTIADFNGYRIRASGEAGKILSEFGAVPVVLPGPEIYEALSRGTIDAVAFPWTYAFGSYKIYEKSKYVSMGINLGTIACCYIANKDAWDALPADFKKYHMEWYNRAPEIWAAEYKKADDKWIPVFKKHVEIVDFPPSERDKLVSKAEEVYEKWVEAREKEGLPGRDVLNFYLKKRKELIGQ